MKKTILSVLFVIGIFTNCANSQQYGVDVLELDNFNFDLNIKQFFQDESIFQGMNKNFSVSAKENHTIVDYNSVSIKYIQYSTNWMSTEHPLASYAGVKFESLGIIADEKNEKVLMAIGSTSYAKGEDIEKIMNALLSEFGNDPKLEENSSYATNFKYSKGNKIANLYLNITLTDSSNKSTYNFSDEKILTPEKYETLKGKMEKEKEIECFLFITNNHFDKALEENRAAAGDLVKYK